MGEKGGATEDELVYWWLAAAGVSTSVAAMWLATTPLALEDDRLLVCGRGGEPIVALCRGNRRPPGGGRVHHYGQGPAALVWLLSAVGSGVLGNAAYDALKSAFSTARSILQRHADGEPAGPARPRDDPAFMFRYWFLADVAVLPERGLRAALIAIASETIEAYNYALPQPLDVDWSTTLVFLISDTSWTVEVGVVGSQRTLAIEIDLAPGEPLGPPVRVFLPWG